MFTTHFKMTTQPFLERTPVDRLLRDERLGQGLARLEYLAKTGSIGLVTGPTGVGKSSLVRLFLSSLSLNLYQPIYLSLTNVGMSGILNLIVTSLGEVPKRGKERVFVQILEKVQKAERSTLLVIDEAHLIPAVTLTDLRLLVSSGLEEGPPLKLLLCGQETLRNRLKSAMHTDLVHRISVRYNVHPLTREQTVSYIDFQLRASGASEKIFEVEAKSLIHDYSNGVPRQINNIAILCLLNAATKNLQKISDKVVNETMSEFQLP